MSHDVLVTFTAAETAAIFDGLRNLAESSWYPTDDAGSIESWQADLLADYLSEGDARTQAFNTFLSLALEAAARSDEARRQMWAELAQARESAPQLPPSRPLPDPTVVAERRAIFDRMVEIGFVKRLPRQETP